MAGQRQSLRKHVWRVVMLIALAPLLFVALGIPFDKLVKNHLQSSAALAATACLEAAVAGDSCGDIAQEEGALVRIYKADQLIEETDAASEASVGWLESLMEPKANQWLVRHEPENLGCEVTAFGRLLICKEEQKSEVANIRVVAITGDIRSVRALSFDGVNKLALQVLLSALLLGWWLGRRIVVPMERLRDSVLERKGRGAYQPILSDDETEVGEVADAFNELLGELDERRQANEAFAADLAHDLKTPIATILASAENLENSSDLSAEDARRYASLLRRNGERLNAVVGDFLELARAEAGLEHAERESLDVGELLTSIVAQFGEASERIALTVSGDTGVHASPRHLQTAFTNVIENALQVAPEGKVAVLAQGADGAVVVSVEDNGPGIAAEDHERVFERFFSRRHGGTGLGLSLARAITRAHDGDLVVDSLSDKGATFRFELPSYESHTKVTQE